MNSAVIWAPADQVAVLRAVLADSKFSSVEFNDEPQTLAAIMETDVVLVSLDSGGDNVADLVETALKLMEAREPGSKALQILQNRAKTVTDFKQDPTAAWLSGWAYASGKVLVTYSKRERLPVAPFTVLAHVTDDERLTTLLETLRVVGGSAEEEAKQLLQIRDQFSQPTEQPVGVLG